MPITYVNEQSSQKQQKTKGRLPVVISRRYHFITKKTMSVTYPPTHTHTPTQILSLFYYSSPFYGTH
ncbi:hypothetical protein DOY81_004557 [Sarcophaga bullata]|nr:hypothetical protein DOY81_004557 [Sarcophaga bullata]